MQLDRCEATRSPASHIWLPCPSVRFVRLCNIKVGAKFPAVLPSGSQCTHGLSAIHMCYIASSGRQNAGSLRLLNYANKDHCLALPCLRSSDFLVVDSYPLVLRVTVRMLSRIIVFGHPGCCRAKEWRRCRQDSISHTALFKDRAMVPTSSDSSRTCSSSTL